MSIERDVPSRSIRTPAVHGRDPLVLMPGGASIPWPPDSDRFAPDAKRALAYAQDEAARLTHNHVGPVHFLVGIIREDEGEGGRVLRELGVTLDAAQSQLASLMPAGEEVYELEDITLTPRAQRVLDFTVARAGERGRPVATIKDILRAVLDEGEHFSSALLVALGVHLDVLRSQMREPPEGGTP